MNVLYICRANFARSQIAEAIHNNLFDSNAKSAGTIPGEYEGIQFRQYGRLELLTCLLEIGIDISDKFPKKLTQKMIKSADSVIVMAEPSTWPDYLKQSPKIEYWEISDPAGRSLYFYRKTRDEIRLRIEDLLENQK